VKSINTGPTTIHYNGKESVMSLADRDYMQYKPSMAVRIIRWLVKHGVM
jgi:hypothetical protein